MTRATPQKAFTNEYHWFFHLNEIPVPSITLPTSVFPGSMIPCSVLLYGLMMPNSSASRGRSRRFGGRVGLGGRGVRRAADARRAP